VNEELPNFFMRPEQTLAGDSESSADPAILLPPGRPQPSHSVTRGARRVRRKRSGRGYWIDMLVEWEVVDALAAGGWKRVLRRGLNQMSSEPSDPSDTSVSSC
jgi:hypothetical protein